MMAGFLAHLIYALAWGSFGLGHSLLARAGVRRRLSGLFGRFYRLAYNLFAAVHFGLVLGLGHWLFGTVAGFEIAPLWRGAMQAAQIIGAVVLLVALAGYDLPLFAGLKQLRQPAQAPEPPPEPLRLEGLHRYVRHPLYLGLLLVLWGGALSEERLALASWASLYLLVGMRFEEQSLIDTYGEAYRVYRRRVPALIPWRGRAV